MATLTEVSYYTRKGIKYSAIGFVVIILAPVILGGIRKLYLTLRPPPPPPPTVRYGKLPILKFPNSETDYKPEYRLETKEGGLPKLPAVAKAYLVDVNKSRLLELDRIKNKAKILGFVNDPEKIDDSTYKFIHPSLPTILTVNVIYGSYIYKYNWAVDQSLYGGQNPPNPDQAFLEAKGFFQGLGILSSDLSEGTPKTTFYLAQPPEMIFSRSLSEANFVRVDLFRSQLDKMPFVTPKAQVSPVYIIFSGINDRSKRVIEAGYSYSKTIEGEFSTYPLRGVDEAWQELQKGNGYVAVTSSQTVTVRNVYLAYYESDQPQEFIQPVYVFEGDGGYVGYVMAISSVYLQ